MKRARDAGVKVYFKTNLLGSRLLELPFGAPIAADPQEAPAVFYYSAPASNQPLCPAHHSEPRVAALAYASRDQTKKLLASSRPG